MKKLPYYFLLPLLFSCSKPQIQQTSFKGSHIVLCKFFLHDVDYSYKMVQVKPGSIIDHQVERFFDPAVVYRDSAIRQFAAAWQTPVLLPSHDFGDKLMKRFKSNKKMIRREHADAGLIVDVSFRIDEKTNLLGKEMLEPYVSINARLINDEGKVIWKGLGSERGVAIRKDKFDPAYDPIHFKDICDNDRARILYQHALEQLITSSQDASMSALIH